MKTAAHRASWLRRRASLQSTSPVLLTNTENSKIAIAIGLDLGTGVRNQAAEPRNARRVSFAYFQSSKEHCHSASGTMSNQAKRFLGRLEIGPICGTASADS